MTHERARGEESLSTQVSRAARERVVVAMSGGVDSAVAAARLHDAGHEVVGVTLHLWDYPEEEDEKAHARCCAPEDQYDARRTADALGFAHYTFDRRELFAKAVVAPFVEAYLAGETPSPCTACNRGVKLAELFAIADRLGARRVATGHYARTTRDEGTGAARVAAGADATKDQSYFLYATPAAWLDRLVFPLGDAMKVDVRAEAIARGLPGATKGESQELCFVGAGGGAYAAFVEERAKGRLRPGPIVDADRARGRRARRHPSLHRRPAQGARRRPRPPRLRLADRRGARHGAPRRGRRTRARIDRCPDRRRRPRRRSLAAAARARTRPLPA